LRQRIAVGMPEILHSAMHTANPHLHRTNRSSVVAARFSFAKQIEMMAAARIKIIGLREV
jgi:hypothetical protein